MTADVEYIERYTIDLKQIFGKSNDKDDLVEYSPWNDIAVDTKLYVCNDGGEWRKRHFSHYANGLVYTFEDGYTSWSGNSSRVNCWQYAKFGE